MPEDNLKYCPIVAHDNVIIRLPMALGVMMGISTSLVCQSYVDLNQIDSENVWYNNYQNIYFNQYSWYEKKIGINKTSKSRLTSGDM